MLCFWLINKIRNLISSANRNNKRIPLVYCRFVLAIVNQPSQDSGQHEILSNLIGRER